MSEAALMAGGRRVRGHAQRRLIRHVEVTYRASCDCGWVGVDYAIQASARAAYHEHLKRERRQAMPISTRRLVAGGTVHEMAVFGVAALCGRELPEPWVWTDDPTSCKPCLLREATYAVTQALEGCAW